MRNSLLGQMRVMNTNSYPCVLDKSPGPYLLPVLVAGLDGEYLQHTDVLPAGLTHIRHASPFQNVPPDERKGDS